MQSSGGSKDNGVRGSICRKSVVARKPLFIRWTSTVDFACRDVFGYLKLHFRAIVLDREV